MTGARRTVDAKSEETRLIACVIKSVALQGVDGGASFMGALGKVKLGLSAAMAVSFHHVTWLSMICAISCSDKVMLACCRPGPLAI